MVAYSFQKRFAPAIIDGSKTQTIRATGKRQHAKSGDLIQLYVGMRTKHCSKIIPDVVCEGCVDIHMEVCIRDFDAIHINGIPLIGDDQLHAFAKQDGFANIYSMHDFWVDTHGYGSFVGKLISWPRAAKIRLSKEGSQKCE